LKAIAVIIPSYNRPELLREALEATLKQSYPPAEIIIVDNASKILVTESLKEWLRGKNSITVLRVDPNVNSAGAFYEGLKYAFQKGFDAYMFFDDDAEPAEDCIKNLMSHFTEGIGVLAPLAYNSIAGEYQLFHNKFMSKGLLFDIPVLSSPENVPSETIRIDANATTGIIVSHQAVEKVGNFNRLLKTYGEDTEFTYRIARHFPCLLVPSAKLLHKVQPSDIRTQPLKNYYWVRNRFHIIKNYSLGRYVAKYALVTVWDGIKQMVRLRNLRTTFYRFSAVGAGLLRTIPTEPVEDSLYRKTNGIRVRVLPH